MRAVWLALDHAQRTGFVQFLDARRLELGLTWDAVAARAGIAEATLEHYRYRPTRSVPGPKVLRKLAVALDVPYPQLLRIVHGDAAPRVTADDHAGD